MPVQGHCFGTPLSSASAGVAVLVKGDAPLTDVRLAAAPEGGRLLDVRATYAGVELSLASCYAPHDGARRPAFFEGPLARLLPRDRPILAAGDWNHVSEPVDLVGAAALGGRGAGAPEFEALQVQLGWVDAWRLTHPGQRAFTHLATTGQSGARLDRWYVPVGLVPWVRSCEILQGWPGDHLAVGLVLAPPTTCQSGPGRFRLPLQLLNDAVFSDAVRARTEQFLAQHPLQEGYTVVQRWEGLKLALRHACVAFAASWRRARVHVESKPEGPEGTHKGSGQRRISIEDLRSVAHMPQLKAARELGIGATRFKMACKELGWHNWPYRKVHEILEDEEKRILQNPSAELDEEFKRFR
eukprot:scaffold8.g1569.t1